jgi:hypothetical protein
VANRTILDGRPGCPRRQRMAEWFARAGAPVERVEELASCHALLGCAVVGMGAALLPVRVLATDADRGRLSVHPWKAPLRDIRTPPIWRSDAPRATGAAFGAMLLAGAPPGHAERRRPDAPGGIAAGGRGSRSPPTGLASGPDPSEPGRGLGRLSRPDRPGLRSNSTSWPSSSSVA